jgi:hypothetical protein
MAGYTKFTNVEVTGALRASGGVSGNVTGKLIGLPTGVSISKSANYTLAAGEKVFYIGITLGAASKTVTLDLDEGAVCIVVNEGGTNAFTCKNVSGDSGTSIAAGKAYLVRASKTANSTKFTLLNDGT